MAACVRRLSGSATSSSEVVELRLLLRIRGRLYDFCCVRACRPAVDGDLFFGFDSIIERR